MSRVLRAVTVLVGVGVLQGALVAPAQARRPPRLSARVVRAVDLKTGEVLFEKGPAAARAIASISKLVAMRVVLDRGLDLRGRTTMVKSDWTYTRGGARTRLVRGREYLNRDLIHAALLGSDNRAVMALGRAVGLNHGAFVAAMNAEAKKLGMTQTHFADPTGIAHENVASPADLITLLKASAAHPALAAITREGAWLTSAKERSGRPLLYRNTNALVRDEARPVRVGKTGFNSAAGWCVASVVTIEGGRQVAIVVLGARTKHLRFADARKVLRLLESR